MATNEITLFVGKGGSLIVKALTPNDPFLIEEIWISKGSATGKVRSKIPIAIPSHVDPSNPGGLRASFLIADGQLKTWSQIQKDIKQLRDNAEFATAVLFEAERDALLTEFSHQTIDLSAGGSAFFGVSNLPLSSTAAFHAEIRIDPIAFDKGSNDVPFLTSSFTGVGEVVGPAGRTTAEFSFEVTVTPDEVVNLLPSISIHPLPKFPALDLHWPKILWPSFNWGSLDLSGLTKLLRFDLPIPASQVRIKWDNNAPVHFQLTVDSQKQLTIRTDPGKTYSGSLICDDGSNNSSPPTFARISLFSFTLTSGGASPGNLRLTGTIVPGLEAFDFPAWMIEQPDLLPFKIEFSPSTMKVAVPTIDLSTQQGGAVTASLEVARITVRAKSDPSLLIALHAIYTQTFNAITGETSGRLETLEILEPYPVKLVTLAGEELSDVAEAMVRFVSAIRLPDTSFPDLSDLGKVLERIADMIGAAVLWLVSRVGANDNPLLGIAQAVGEILTKLVKMLIDAIKKLATGQAVAPWHLLIEVRLDSRTHALRQIVITPAWGSVAPDHFTGGADLGVSIDIPLNWKPIFVIDLNGSPSVALLACPPKDGSLATIGTDLWLSHDAGMEAVRDTNTQGHRVKDRRLIQVQFEFKRDNLAVALISIARGKVQFLRACEAKIAVKAITLPPWTNLPPNLTVATISGGINYTKALDWTAVDTNLSAQTDRLLPFLQSSEKTGPSFLDTLSQYVQVKAPGKPLSQGNGVFDLPIGVELKIKDASVDFDLNVIIDVKDLSVRLKGDNPIVILGDESSSVFNLLGLQGNIVLRSKSDKWPRPSDKKYPFFNLNFSSGDAQLRLAPEARLDLSYGQVASGGRGIVFLVDSLGISRGGLDLDAKVDHETPVQLAGVDMPFRFDSGGLSIKRSQIQAFSITGAGQLPPELVGEANATISISMGQGADGSLIVQSAEAKLDKANDPIVCHATRFVLTISALGFEFQNFASEGSGYHFYFTLTGTAEFRPREGEFTDGLLKYLGSITITLDKAPLARDSSMLLRAISFQVAVVPAKHFNFFNLFSFELRGIGFHPASAAFGGKPALSISGQVNFVDAGDIVSPKFDFHQLWIAPPLQGQSLPQVRFDGLTLGVRFGGAASIEGTAIAVDDSLPSLSPSALSKDVTARGFLASGKVTIKGWGAMSAAMGFLELRKPGGDLRRAFFLYGEADDLSIEIPTPVGPIYLREVGFGFGYRFTIAAFNRADQVTSVSDLIKVLDEISKYQGNLASLRSWQPEAEGNRVTLALRGLITIESASEENEYNADDEKELPNPILFDIVAAMRSDFTFFMSARVWIARNYADWHDSSANDPWRNNPTLRGYVYLSVPRKEFLGRLIADGTGDVDGTHPKLPAPLVKAMKGIRWSATTYIRPGLFHQEFGWPYELGFTLEEKQGGGRFQIVCQGGLINRIEDGAMLYGIAFRARGYAQFGGQVGGRSFGTSVAARADFSIDAKFIAYISVKRFSDTLFYGSVAFDVSISLEVRIWLEFSVGFTDIHIEVGFSISLTISIALEVAATPSSIAARGSASVAVGAFGRHVRLGIAFAVNPGRLNEARARVERFMQLGLTVSMPDAEQGVAPPAAELPRGPRAGNADRAADNALDKHDQLTACDPPIPTAPGQPQPLAKGRPLQQSGYWAMLFPIIGEERKDLGDKRYIMIFVPRDHTETGLDNSALPQFGNDGESFSSFYAPPSVFESADNTFPIALNIAARKNHDGTSMLSRSVEVLRLDPISGPQPAQFGSDPTSPMQITYNLNWKVAVSGSETLKLGQFMAQCFIRDRNAASASELREPLDTRIIANPQRLPDTREAAAQVLTDAGRDQIALGIEYRAANDIEERRSSAIASFCNTAALLAAGAEDSWKSPAAAVGLDIRLLGLAFVVKGSDIDVLFEPPKGNTPRAAYFNLLAAVSSIAAFDGNVHLFNPPDRMFRERGPRLAEPVIEATSSGVRLDWDLEPPVGLSSGVWNDPEFDLKHYRIERIITKLDSLVSLYQPMRTTAKAAAPLNLVRDPVSGNFVWRFIRPNAQFVDDLSDLPDDVRRAIFPPSNVTETKRGAPAPLAIIAKPPPYVLRYTIVPVDTAGTDGPPTPLVLQSQQVGRVRKAVSRAVLNFEYRGDAATVIADVTASESLIPIFRLGIDDGIDAMPPDPKKPPVLDRDRSYWLRVRKEQSIPIGLYGSDAVGDARARPSAGDFAIKRATDEDFRITLAAGVMQPTFDIPVEVKAATGVDSFPGYIIDDRDRFMLAIGASQTAQQRLDSGPVSVRFAIQPAKMSGEDEAPWCPMDTTLLIAINHSDDRLPAVAAPVELFEHPVRIDSAPLLSEDLDGDAGRVAVLHPLVSMDKTLAPATVEQLVSDEAIRSPLQRMRDVTRRVGTCLQWNARPAAQETQLANRSARRNAPFFGGYDIFELDAAEEAEGATSAPTALALRYPFNKSVIDADPGNWLRYDNTKGAIYVGGSQTAELDALSNSAAMHGAHVRLMSASNRAKGMTFHLNVYARARGYRKLMVAPFPQASVPFDDGEPLILFLTTDPPAKHVARVQALPASLARLDPSEITDFGKVEAHYPSETLRLIAPIAGRQREWYSPAESFLVWPSRTLRRSLSINVDESILTEMLSNGRPTRISMQLTIADKHRGTVLHPINDGFETVSAEGLPAPGGQWTAGILREFLQSLVWDSHDPKIRQAFCEDPAQFHNGRITLRALKSSEQPNVPDIELARADWGIDLDPPLHPVLADVIDFARYKRSPTRVLRYPHLTLKEGEATKLEIWLSSLSTTFGPIVSFSVSGWDAPMVQPAIGFQADTESTFPVDGKVSEFRILAGASRSETVNQIKDAVKRLAIRLDGDQLTQLSRAAFSANLTIDLGNRQQPSFFAIDTQALIKLAEPDQGPKYRLYEPVLEQLPRVNSKDVAGWFDETPPQRDPYGWSVMRTIGLAAGLKLYDTESRDYVSPKETLRQLKLAFANILSRYADQHDDVGSPFIDVITRAGGTMSLASFDGGMSGVTTTEVQALLDDQALSLVQISLRPTVDRFANLWIHGSGETGWKQIPIDKVSAYFAVEAAGAGKVTIDLDQLPSCSAIVIAEVIDLTSGLAKAPIFTLTPTKYDADLTQLRYALLDGAGEQNKLEVNHANEGQIVAVIRVTVSSGDAAAIVSSGATVPWVIGATVTEISQPIDFTKPAQVTVFGRFPDMTSRRFGALAGEGGHPSVRNAVGTLRGYIEKRFPNGWTDEPTLIQRIPEWTRRFFDNGPTSMPNWRVGPLFSVCEVTRPDPWRVGVAPDGTMKVLFTHDDRKRRLKRYAIRPFGRYDNFVDALKYASDPNALPVQPRLGGAWSDVFASSSDPQQAFEDNWGRRFVDIVIPRTEPLASPVLIDARRVEIFPPQFDSTAKSRKVLEFIFARHPEEILSEANVTVEGASSFEGVSFGFWREFPMQTWANDISPGVSTTASFGDWTTASPFEPIESNDGFGGLAYLDNDGKVLGRDPYGWRGALALRTESLPFFFRTHLAAFASAGVVVSDPVVASIEEGHYLLTLPWQKGSPSELLVPTEPPHWSVSRQPDGPHPGLWVTFNLPVARFFDSMLQDSRKIWLEGRPIPDVFMLPDPQVRYEISVVAADDAGLCAASAELDIVATQRAVTQPLDLPSPPVPLSQKSGYRTNLIGPLFDPADSPPTPRLEHVGTTWTLCSSARLRGGVELSSVFEPLIKPAQHPVGNADDALRLFEISPTDFPVWSTVAPATTVQFTVTPPLKSADLPAFKAGVTSWLNLFAPYAAASPGAMQVADFLEKWINTNPTTTPRPAASLTITAFAAGLPRLTNPSPVVVMNQLSSIWTWPSPADVGIAQRENVRSIQTGGAHAENYSEAEFVTGIIAPVTAEMRRISEVRIESKSRFQNYPPLAVVLPAGTLVDDAVALMKTQNLPECIDIVIAIPITVDFGSPGIEDKIVKLVRAVEAAPFTAMAIQDLGALEEHVTPTLQMHLPSSALTGEIIGALTALDPSAIGQQKPWSVLLRQIPVDAERTRIMTAIDGLQITQNRRASLKTFIHRGMTDQIFGTGRSPYVKAYRGSSVPQQDLIPRKGYLWPIP
jgi:hypothetical protein